MREAYRLQRNEYCLVAEGSGDRLVIFFIYIGKELPGYGLVFEKTATALQKIVQQIREQR